MAWIERRGKKYRICFRYSGRLWRHRLKTDNEGEAEGCRIRLEENLRFVERGRLVAPLNSATVRNCLSRYDGSHPWITFSNAS